MRTIRSITALALIALICLMTGVAGCRQPEAPEYYGFQNLQLTRTVDGQSILSTTLKFYNPNPFDVQLKGAEMDVKLNGKPAGHSVLDSTVAILRKDTFYVPVALQVNLQGILSNALQIFMEKQVTITLDGRVHLKRGMVPFSRPFHYEQKQDLSNLQNLLQGM